MEAERVHYTYVHRRVLIDNDSLLKYTMLISCGEISHALFIS